MRARMLAIVAGLGVATAVVPAAARADHTPAPSAVTVVGNLQDELGCLGDWDPGCADTGLTYDAGDDAWQATFTVPAGS
jgi:Pullulanase X25 domain